MIKNILIAPDSFKGGVSSREFCEIVSDEIRSIAPEINVKCVPIADGGEGTLDSLHSSAGGSIETFPAANPFGEPITARVLFTDCKTAVIESAECIGLPLIKGRENPERASTFGLGLLIEQAVSAGAEKIILTLGGSSTNDCGAGMLAAMGLLFYDSQGQPFIPSGATLGRVVRIEETEKFSAFAGVGFSAMCDVSNPLYGEKGCTRVFARQKGADEKMILRLEKNVRSFAARSADFLGVDYAGGSGAGAAGGLGFACAAYLRGELKSGAETVLELCGFDALARASDLIISGEGRFDEQSVMGKAVGSVLKHSSGKPVAVICGKHRPFDASEYTNLSYVIPVSEGQDTEYAIMHEPENIRRGIGRLFKMIEGTVPPASCEKPSKIF